MHSAPDRRRVHFQTAFLHYLYKILIVDPVLAVPADTKQDDLDWKTTTLEHDPS
jgi:hypothetical protein